MQGEWGGVVEVLVPYYGALCKWTLFDPRTLEVGTSEGVIIAVNKVLLVG